MKNFFSHLFLSRHVLSKLFICFAIPRNFNFAVNLVTSFSRQKPLKSKNKKHRIFWNTEFYHPAKFELKRIKNAKVVTTLQLFACVLAQREHRSLNTGHNAGHKRKSTNLCYQAVFRLGSRILVQAPTQIGAVFRHFAPHIFIRA